jgi:superfamily II DNA or RNA helicase
LKELRPYQQECINAAISASKRGVTKMLAVLFTGAGKTYLTIKLLEQYGFKRVLWLCWQEDLINQSALAFIREKFDDRFYNHVREVGFVNYVEDGGLFAMKDFKMGCIKATCFKPDANVVMGSVATIHRRLDLLPPDYFDCIVTDESHLFGSITAVKTLNYFTPKLLFGITATPYRTDGMLMGDIYDEIIYEYGLDKGIKDGYACELDGIKVQTNVSLDNVKTTAGDLNQKELSNEINTLARNQLISNSYKKYCDGRQGIAFCVDIQHAKDLADTFQRNGINAVAVSSDEERTPNRTENIKRFQDGKIQILTNVGILTTGFDHVNTGCALMACPTKSLTKYLQSAGRVARLKTLDYVQRFGQNAIILDFLDLTDRHNLINCWSLDKAKNIEDRTFTTKEKKEKLLDARKKRYEGAERKKDERVKLLALPKAIRVSNSIKMTEPITAPQKEWLKRLNFDPDTTNYTKKMAFDIISAEKAAKYKIQILKDCGYDVADSFVTNGIFENAKKLNKKVADMYEIKSKQLIKK